MKDREQFEQKGLKSLQRIEKDLEDLKGNPKRTFFNGVLYGAGAFVGGVLAIVLIGWLLSIAGLIPGVGELVDYVQRAIDAR
jgi:hypothetical protein